MSTSNIPGGPTIVLVHGAFADASSWNLIMISQPQVVTDHIVKAARSVAASPR